MGPPAANQSGPNQAGPQFGGPANDPPPAQPPPPQLTLKPGTFITVRVNQVLNSDRNQAGDGFSATLIKPVIVDGVVVADRGQTIGGRVTEAKKAGRISGVSHLGIELTDLTVADGDQIPVHTQLIGRNGSTSVGRDATVIGGTTALGAATGAAAAWGTGAAIGAGAGAAAGIIGVLLTRGNPTVITPETILTFRVQDPITISTERAPQAFRPVTPADYQQAAAQPQLARRPPPPGAYYGPGYYPYGYGYGYPYYYGYPYWGPGFSFYYGPGFHRWR